MARAYLNRGLLKISKNDANGCNDLQQAKKLHSAEADQYLKKYCKTNWQKKALLKMLFNFL